MGLFSRFENKAEDIIEGGGKGGIEPVKIAKRAYKEMQREKMVGVGHEYAPTLYNVLVSTQDDARMSGYYPSLAGQIETYLTGRAESSGLIFDCPPLVRFIVDDTLKHGRFDIIAENVSPQIIDELRKEEMEHYGIEAPSRGPRTPEPPAPEAYMPEDAFEPSDAFAPSSAPVAEEPVPASEDYYTPTSADEPWGETSEPADDFAGSAVAAAAPVAAPVPEPAPAPAPEPEPVMPAAVARPVAVDEDANETVLLNAVPEQPPAAALYDYTTLQRYPLQGTRVVIGRGTSCDIIINDPSVSRHHGEILRDENGWLIRDTGSTNGTRVNGEHVNQSRIYNGDVLGLGAVQLEFQEG